MTLQVPPEEHPAFPPCGISDLVVRVSNDGPESMTGPALFAFGLGLYEPCRKRRDPAQRTFGHPQLAFNEANASLDLAPFVAALEEVARSPRQHGADD